MAKRVMMKRRTRTRKRDPQTRATLTAMVSCELALVGVGAARGSGQWGERGLGVQSMWMGMMWSMRSARLSCAFDLEKWE